MMKKCQKINLQEPQRNRNATANFVNLIRTSTVSARANVLQIFRGEPVQGHFRGFLGKLTVSG